MDLKLKMLMAPDDGDGAGGDPEGVSDIDPGETKSPTMEELNARLNAIETENKSLKAERGQLLTTLASVEKLVPGQRAPREEGDDDDEEPLDPAVQKRLAKELAKIDAKHSERYAELTEARDFDSFMQTAATMGMSNDEFDAAEKDYARARSDGMVVKTKNGRERPVTRLDILDLKLGREVRTARAREAPTKQFDQLRERLAGNAGMENPGGGSRAVKGLDLETLKREPEVGKRLGALEKSLKDVEI